MSTRTVHTLANGLTLVVEPDHHAPAVAVDLWYRVGSRNEVLGRTGLAHLFEHLMFQGSADVKAGEHFAALDSFGARLNATTFFDRTNYFQAVPSGVLDLVLWLESNRMGGLLEALDQQNLDTQREVVRNERLQTFDNRPYGTAMELLFAALFPEGHQYHHMAIGSMTDLDAATLDDVRNFFITHYHPGNAVISIVGDVTAEAAIAAVERYFGGIDAAPAAPVREPQPLPPAVDVVRLHIDDEPVPAAAVRLMWRVPADDQPGCAELDLAGRALGSIAGSRLHNSLVRNQSLAQDVSSGLLPLIGGNSVLYAEAIASDGVTSEVLTEAMLALLGDFHVSGPTDVELQAAKAQAEVDFLRGTQDLIGRADTLARGLAFYDDPDREERALESQLALSRDAVAQAVATWLDPASAAVLTHDLPEAS